ncbi:hypothetical protein Aduo_015374 [Ancylostoma duodenale]
MSDVDVVVKKKQTAKVKSRVESDDEDERDDETDVEFDVVVRNELPNTELYRVQFPVRKKDAFEQERQPRVRYKKNVRMMEMRLSADTLSGSYDKTKAERFAAMTSSNVRQENIVAHSKFDEIYEGRAYRSLYRSRAVCSRIFSWCLDTFYMSPVAGTFEMHRSLSHINNASRGRDDDGDDGESDSEAAGGSAQQIRVKFSRPETEKQKKRREATALHREKLIASDSSIPMEDPLVVEKFSQMTVDPTATTTDEPGSSIEMNTRDLVEQGIVCGEKEQIDLTRSDLLVSQQRIREMPAHYQVKAQVLKSRVITFDNVVKRVDSSLTREEIIEDLKQCTRLVQGVWVLNSIFLFYDLKRQSGVCCLPDKTSTDNSRSVVINYTQCGTLLFCRGYGEYISSRHRIMNMVEANYNSGSSPDTASTDDKEKQMTPTSKTNKWLRRLTQEASPLSSPRPSDDVEPTPDDRVSSHSDPRGSQLDAMGDPVEKQAPVKRKKFPLGATENERGSKHVVVERF